MLDPSISRCPFHHASFPGSLYLTVKAWALWKFIFSPLVLYPTPAQWILFKMMAYIDSVHHRKSLTWYCLCSFLVFSMPFLSIRAPESCPPKQWDRHQLLTSLVVHSTMCCEELFEVFRLIGFPCFGNTELLVIPHHRLDTCYLLPDRRYELVYSCFRVRRSYLWWPAHLWLSGDSFDSLYHTNTLTSYASIIWFMTAFKPASW